MARFRRWRGLKVEGTLGLGKYYESHQYEKEGVAVPLTVTAGQLWRLPVERVDLLFEISRTMSGESSVPG